MIRFDRGEDLLHYFCKREGGQSSSASNCLEPGGTYYSFRWSLGGVDKHIYTGSKRDEKALETKNFFKTREEALEVLEAIKIYLELKKFSGPWRMDDMDFGLEYEPETDDLGVGIWTLLANNPIVFHSASDAEAAIEAVGADRLKRYWFGIKQEDS